MAIVFNNLSGGGGGSKLYRHLVKFSSNQNYHYAVIYTNDATPFTNTTLNQWILDNGYTYQNCYPTYSRLDQEGTNKIRLFMGLYSNGVVLQGRYNQITFSADFSGATFDLSYQNNGIRMDMDTDTVTEV